MQKLFTTKQIIKSFPLSKTSSLSSDKSHSTSVPTSHLKQQKSGMGKFLLEELSFFCPIIITRIWLTTTKPIKYSVWINGSRPFLNPWKNSLLYMYQCIMYNHVNKVLGVAFKYLRESRSCYCKNFSLHLLEKLSSSCPDWNH